MPTPSWTVSFTMPTASNSPAKACAGHEANRTRRLDQPPSPVTQIHRPARLATRAASFRYGGRHHSGIPGDIIPLYPGDFVGIRTEIAFSVLLDTNFSCVCAKNRTCVCRHSCKYTESPHVHSFFFSHTPAERVSSRDCSLED